MIGDVVVYPTRTSRVTLIIQCNCTYLLTYVREGCAQCYVLLRLLYPEMRASYHHVTIMYTYNYQPQNVGGAMSRLYSLHEGVTISVPGI